jgi:RNA-binding protein YhbY
MRGNAASREQDVPLSTKQLKELAAKANRLAAAATIGDGPLSDASVEHVAALFAKSELCKVRINAADRGNFEQIGSQLAVRLGGEIVSRVGRVIVVYRPREPQ